MTDERHYAYDDGFFSIRMTVIRGGAGPAPYPLSATQWRRAVKMIRAYGVDGSLNLMDGRAEAAVDRRDIRTAELWRDLMVAVLVMSSEKRRRGEAVN